jgi:hypothetical protein
MVRRDLFENKKSPCSHLYRIGSSMSPTFSRIPKLFYKNSTSYKKLAKPSFGWLLSHIPHESGIEKTLAI